MRSPSQRPYRSAVIAGAGTGLGRDIALCLSERGYIVFGTAMTAHEVAELRSTSKGRVSLIICNMRMDSPVTAWAEGVSDAVGDAGVDLLIVVASAFETMLRDVGPDDGAGHGFDVRVFVTAFVTALCKARGRVVLVGSSKQDLSFVDWSELVSAGLDVLTVSDEMLAPEASDPPASGTDMSPATDAGLAASAARIIELAEQRRPFCTLPPQEPS